jgi:iron complex transport system ATP-binding protein
MDAARAAASQGTAVLTVLHDLNLAARYADALVLMRKGQIMGCGPPPVVLSDAALSDVFGLSLATTSSLTGKAEFIVPSRWIGRRANF